MLNFIKELKTKKMINRGVHRFSFSMPYIAFNRAIIADIVFAQY